jgi:predicted ATPase/class 3 adenylate cyclase
VFVLLWDRNGPDRKSPSVPTAAFPGRSTTVPKCGWLHLRDARVGKRPEPRNPQVLAKLPSGTVTFLFTDVEGSTRLLQELGDRYAGVLAEHRRVLRDVFARHGGVEVDTQGDAFFVAFVKASDALAAAEEATKALQSGPIRVRMGLHTGEPLVTEEGYVGIDVHRAARVAAAGYGGQILVSQSTRDLSGSALLMDLGEHRLKDLALPERIYQFGESKFPPLKSLNQTNLPMQPTPLVGRRRELQEVLALLRANRLVTLTGAGGSGKTRLALQAAAELVEEFPDGIWFVSLAALTDAELVLPTIASTLGAKEELERFLRSRRLLLVLDNLEQLLPAAAGRIAELLADPQVKLLATSRERLALGAEHEYAVPTLPLDDAVALFTNRARQLQHSFEADEHVTELAHRLDGLPLALELAAARVKILTPDKILGRLGQSLDLLTGGASDAPERHRTLRATIEWSYDLLDDTERRLFGCVGVFAGSFDIEAAEAVCDAELDTLQSLVDKSLIRQTGDGRFFILDTIREFAREKLRELADPDDLNRRHASYFLELADRAEPEFSGVEQEFWLGLLDANIENIRLTLRHALDSDDAEVALRLAASLRQFWDSSDRLPEAILWLEEGLDAKEEVRPLIRAKAVLALARSRFYVGDEASAAAGTAKALELYRALGDKRGEALALEGMGDIAWSSGDVKRAEELHSASLALYESLGEPGGIILALRHVGQSAQELGESNRAVALFERAQSLARETGNAREWAATTHSLADLFLDELELDRATDLYVQVLQQSQPIGATRITAFCVAGLAAVAAARGQEEGAAFLWGSVERFEETTRTPLLAADRARYEPVVRHALEHHPSELELGRKLSLADAVEHALAALD